MVVVGRKKIRIFTKAIASALVFAMMLMTFIPGVNSNTARADDVINEGSIVEFLQSGLVFETWVELGTLWEDLQLPAQLTALVEVTADNPSPAQSGESDDNETMSEGNEPGQSAYEGNIPEAGETEEQGFIIPDSENAEPPEAGHGSNGSHAETEAKTEEPDPNEPISGGNEAAETETYVISVRWEGYYNGSEPGVYILTALAEGYSYHGEYPTAKITVEAPPIPAQGPQMGSTRGGDDPDYVIDIGSSPQTVPHVVPQPGGKYTGYDMSAVSTANRTIDFNTAANGYKYEIIQTGAYGGYWTINLTAGIDTTIILNGVNTIVYLNLFDDARLTLLLAGENNFKYGYIVVRENTKLTIDSANTRGSENGKLIIKNESTTFAAIGGFYRGANNTKSNSGLITINGGTIDITQVIKAGNMHSAGIGGGGDGASNATSGNVVINGGHVSVSVENNTNSRQNGALIGGGSGSHGHVTINGGTVIATNDANSQGAAIGGGFGGNGTVYIHDGTVKATIPPSGGSSGATPGSGAAIGGGKGSGSSTAGIGNVTITGGHVIANARYGAAIGGGMRSSNAKIDISGGLIEATVAHGTGAAIGGGGGGIGTDTGLIGGNLDINISDGVLKLKADLGSAIGLGGYERASAPNHAGGLSGYVTITGGVITADVIAGNGVGSGWDNLIVPVIKIDKEADILVFGRERTAFAGIYSGDNTAAFNGGGNLGTGYYVNLNFPDDKNDLSALKSGTDIIVFSAGDMTNPVRTIAVSFNIGMLSFTTGKDFAENFHIYAQTAAGIKQLAHPSDIRPAPFPTDYTKIIYNDYRIYSVKSTFAYHGNGHVHDNHYRSLPLKIDTGSAALLKVTEKYVSPDGTAIPGQPDTFIYVSAGGLYDRIIPDNITGFKAVGFKWNIPPSGIGSYDLGVQVRLNITEDKIIHFVYALYSEVDVTVSKTVKGSFADKSLQFTFTVSFTDSSGKELPAGKTFNYKGGTLNNMGATAPPNGTLTLKTGGWDTFTLEHGQTIIIEDVPSDIRIKIIETPIDNYLMTYRDSINPDVQSKGDMAFSPVGINARRFDFTNTIISVTPMGIEDSSVSIAAIAIIAAMVMTTGFITAEIIKRRLVTPRKRI